MENKARKMFAAVVVIMLCAVAIVGVGYAYTASTLNSGNSTVSHYVVLSQRDYTFDDDSVLNFNTETKYDTVAKIRYTLTQPAESSTLDNVVRHIYELGDDQLTGSRSDGSTAVLKVTVSMSFANLSEKFGSLLVKIAPSEGTDYYVVVYDGSSYVYKHYNGSSWDDWVNNYFVISDGVTYNTSLYLDAASGKSTDWTPISESPVPPRLSGTVTFAWDSATV